MSEKLLSSEPSVVYGQPVYTQQQPVVYSTNTQNVQTTHVSAIIISYKSFSLRSLIISLRFFSLLSQANQFITITIPSLIWDRWGTARLKEIGGIIYAIVAEICGPVVVVSLYLMAFGCLLKVSEYILMKYIIVLTALWLIYLIIITLLVYSVRQDWILYIQEFNICFSINMVYLFYRLIICPICICYTSDLYLSI